jgi:hypothetical protein
MIYLGSNLWLYLLETVGCTLGLWSCGDPRHFPRSPNFLLLPIVRNCQLPPPPTPSCRRTSPKQDDIRSSLNPPSQSYSGPPVRVNPLTLLSALSKKNPYSKNNTSCPALLGMIAECRFYQNRRQALSRAIKGQIRLLELQKEHGWNRDTLITALVLLDDPYPIFLHFTAFMAVIEAQGTKEQIEEWIPQCERMEILGFPLP